MNETAATTWAQLGGNRVSAMIGVKHITFTADTLNVRFMARATNGANHVAIKLDASDTYTVTFYSCRGVKIRTVSEHSDVYADSLRTLFTAETGLYLSL